MNAVERWKRMTHPQTVEDYGLSVTIEELRDTEEGRKIVEDEIMPLMPVWFEPK